MGLNRGEVATDGSQAVTDGEQRSVGRVFDKHTDEDRVEEEVEDFEADVPEDVFVLYDGDEEENEEEAAEEEGAEDEGLILEDEEEAPESSLDELLDRRAAGATLDEDESEVAELFELFPLREEMSGSTPARPEPAAPSEFVCERCRLVKARAQLSDAARLLCRDCA
jgi:Domain of unknown function (DUF4193)